MSNGAIVLVRTTFPSKGKADEVTATLLREKLIACVHCYEVESQYVWEGKHCKETETVAEYKTTVVCERRLYDRLAQLHPYDTPEILSIAVSHASEHYKAWVASSVRGGA